MSVSSNKSKGLPFIGLLWQLSSPGHQLVKLIWSVDNVRLRLFLVKRKSNTKVCTLKNNTNLNSIFCLVKSSKIDFIFHLHYIWLYGCWYYQEIWKNSHFENMTAGFLRRFTSEMIHFQAWKKIFQTVIMS